MFILDRCQRIGRCLDDAFTQESTRNVNECMNLCLEKRGCDYSSYSTADNVCTLHRSCENFDSNKLQYTSSKWDCEIVEGKKHN